MMVAGGDLEFNPKTPNSASSTAADKLFIVQPLRGFCLERRILNLNSTIQQLDASTLRQFDNLGSQVLILTSSY
jgi:hypothetical protein